MSEELIMRTAPEGTSLLDNSEIRKIAEDALNGLKYSFVAAAANPDTPLPAGGVEESFRRAVKARRADVVAKYQTRARTLAAAPPAERQTKFGRYGRLSVADHARLGLGAADAQLPRLDIKPALLTPVIKGLRAKLVAAEEAAPEPALAGPTHTAARGGNQKFKIKLPGVKTLGFYITEVKCVDETDGFLGSEAGDDEILMGGLAVDERGEVSKISPFMVGNEFDDGEKKTYSPHKRFCEFDARKTSKYPKTFSAVVFLAEEDMGGFADGLTAAWQQAGPLIKGKIKDAVASQGEGIWWQVLAEVVVWVVDAFVRWLVDIFADDLFKPGKAFAVLNTPLAGAYKSQSGWSNMQTPEGKFTFKGHGGTYTVKCYWKVAPTS